MISEYKDNYTLGKERFKSDSNDCQNVKKLGENYSTSLAASDLSENKISISTTIYNEKHAILKPVFDSDYRTNYLAPDKKDYRKKRTQILYPNYPGSSIAKETISQYKKNF